MVASEAKVCLSEPPAQGLTPALIGTERVELATPHLLVELAAAQDLVLRY
jgi:hypothetical protein